MKLYLQSDILRHPLPLILRLRIRSCTHIALSPNSWRADISRKARCLRQNWSHACRRKNHGWHKDLVTIVKDKSLTRLHTLFHLRESESSVLSTVWYCPQQSTSFNPHNYGCPAWVYYIYPQTWLTGTHLFNCAYLCRYSLLLGCDFRGSHKISWMHIKVIKLTTHNFTSQELSWVFL